MTRAFDFLAALFGLLLLLPLLLLIALIVKLEDGGPVFFRQERVGRHGRPFKIWKYRTMVVNAERLGRAITVGQDPRITQSGYWLRRWKLDELPQLLNVLTGEMGLVGPRPEVQRYVSRYSEDQKKVLELRPGITDLASIAYRNESELLEDQDDLSAYYVQMIMPDKIRINLEYARHANLWRSIKVVLATLGLLDPKEQSPV